jgi:hypothetical protein
MKRAIINLCFLASLITGCASCDKGAAAPMPVTTGGGSNNDSIPNTPGSQMRIKIGAATFTATLYDNATATAFKERLPITANMVELNGNEKYVDLPGSLPTGASNPGAIQSGDLMLYGSNTLVLFYKSFSTSYSYTRLGRITDTTGLAAAVGLGNVAVTFEL